MSLKNNLPHPYCSKLSSVCFMSYAFKAFFNVHHAHYALFFLFIISISIFPMTAYSYGLLFICVSFPLCIIFVLNCSYCSTYVCYVQINTTYITSLLYSICHYVSESRFFNRISPKIACNFAKGSPIIIFFHYQI